MNIKQNTLAALLVLGIGMSGCNTTNTLPTTIVEKSQKEASQVIIDYAVDNTKPVPTVQDYTDANITGVNADNLATINAKLGTLSASIVADNVVDLVQKMVNDVINVVDRNGTDPENNDTNITATILEFIGSQHSKGESNITVAQLKKITPALENINDDYQDSYRSYIASADSNFSLPATRDEVQSMIDEVNRLVPVSNATLADIATQHSNGSSDITVAKLKAITPALDNIEETNEKWYQSYIEGSDTKISSPATIKELQSMIDEVNGFNLPANAILDRKFYKKTNEEFEHRFVYLPVKNTTTGKTWLNNNLGAEYANINNPRNNYNPSQQAKTSNDYLAYGSLFQWGRAADGHELITWFENKRGRTKYALTERRADHPRTPAFIIVSDYPNDWRENTRDELWPLYSFWESESSQNNVCPVGYRLPLNPNYANDSANEFYQEIQTWTQENGVGALNSVLKLSLAGNRQGSTGWLDKSSTYGFYWTGSRYDFYALDMFLTPANVFPNYHDDRANGFSVRCIKD